MSGDHGSGQHTAASIFFVQQGRRTAYHFCITRKKYKERLEGQFHRCIVAGVSLILENLTSTTHTLT
jgi:hypothetical protein